MSRDNHANINVVGFHGRKGNKEDPTIMGTAVNHLSIESTCPVLIIKDAKTRKESPEGVYRYACCIDGSKRSMEALDTITKIKAPEDKISIIICE